MVLFQKWHFSNFFVSHYRPVKCLLRTFFWRYIPGKCLLGYPFFRLWNKKFKKSKNWHFSKSFNSRFFSKNDHFSNIVFFRQYRPGKCLLRYSWTKNPFSRLWNKKFKKSKNCHFSKGVNPWFFSKNDHFYKFFFFRQYRPGKVLLRYSRLKKRLSRL